MTVDHLGEFLVRFEPLPLRVRTPVVEEAPRPTFDFVLPELTEGFLQQIGPVESLVGRQQFLERLPAAQQIRNAYLSRGERSDSRASENLTMDGRSLRRRLTTVDDNDIKAFNSSCHHRTHAPRSRHRDARRLLSGN
ncbi:MAG: hypothetical protein ABI440_01960 [Casimicrobiaceae bacterium]